MLCCWATDGTLSMVKGARMSRQVLWRMMRAIVLLVGVSEHPLFKSLYTLHFHFILPISIG